MNNTNEKNNRNMLYWLCCELLACLGWGAGLLAVFFTLGCIIALIANISEPIVAPVVILASSGSILALIIFWAYGYIKSRRNEQPTDKREWSKFTKVICILFFKGIVGGFVIIYSIMAVLVILALAMENMSPIHWLIAAVVGAVLLCAGTLLLLYIVNSFCNFYHFSCFT